jgi:hypothetical protein
MLAYVFWHVPFPGIAAKAYEAALLEFQSALASTPPPWLLSCAAYRIPEVPWLNGHRGYEDWYILESPAALGILNKAAVSPEHWGAHSAIADKMDFGHGGLYEYLQGDAQSLNGMRAVWLKRPRGIRYQQPLREMISRSAGFLSCWRRQMVLGPADEFAVIGTMDLNLPVLGGWTARTVERARLVSAPSAA